MIHKLFIHWWKGTHHNTTRVSQQYYQWGRLLL
jgi:hypothetical protein